MLFFSVVLTENGDEIVSGPELQSKGCAVRVTDRDHKEVYRTPLDPVPAWRR